MKKFSAALAIAFTAAVSLSAIVTFDPSTGTGFVGKGDVQLVYGWNNKALQDGAGTVQFRVNSVTETAWTCTKVREDHPQGDQVQERQRTTTIQGLVNDVARDNSKGKNGPVTGFNLLGFNGGSVIQTDGPAVGTCPANPSGFVYDENAETVSIGGGGLEVSINGAEWFPLQ